MTVTRKIQLKSLIAHARNPIVPFRFERRWPRFCREILLPRSGDVIHPLLWRGSGYETTLWGRCGSPDIYIWGSLGTRLLLDGPARYAPDLGVCVLGPACSPARDCVGVCRSDPVHGVTSRIYRVTEIRRWLLGRVVAQAWSRPAASDLRECLDCACSVCMYATHALCLRGACSVSRV